MIHALLPLRYKLHYGSIELLVHNYRHTRKADTLTVAAEMRREYRV